jgi:heptosyltransferase II
MGGLKTKILILKVGALGDVLRTTPLLTVLEGKVTWVTSEAAAPLLAGNPFIDRLYCQEHYHDSLFDDHFDLVLNLEDELPAATLASKIKTKSLIGAYAYGDQVVYTESASEWFDMSLISRFGKMKADQLKMNNRRTYQDFIFSMMGCHFHAEEYVLNISLKKIPIPSLVGLEVRAGAVWPMKRWNKFEALGHRLEKVGFKVKIFQQRDQLRDYVDDINECECVVCGDTLAMHIGLGLRKRVVAIFTCTSPHEIYDYQRMIKIVSPLWKEYFYRRDFEPAPAEAISVESVLDAVKALSNLRLR